MKEGVKLTIMGFLILLGFVLLFYPPYMWLGEIATGLLPEWIVNYSILENLNRNGWVIAGSIIIGGVIALCRLAMSWI